VLSLFPETAAVEDGRLAIGGIGASALAEEFGTPLVVYCRRTIEDAARAYREAAPDALPLYSLKALPNVAILRLLAEEGFGADVSTLGELAFALEAGVPGERIVVHGNNKSDEELRAAAEANVRFVVLDALDEVERAAAAGVRDVLVRVTPGIAADTHEKIRTAHEGSKFGLPPGQALQAVATAREAGLEPAGIHLHIGSQLLRMDAGLETVDWLGPFLARARDEIDWESATSRRTSRPGSPTSSLRCSPDSLTRGRASRPR
jgi:diaminopimelate decarboxylase